MGYGKTTAVRETLRNMDVKILWQTIYESGNDEFWRCICAAVTAVDKRIAADLGRIGIPSNYKMLRKTLELFQELRLTSETYLVIDDYHLVKSKQGDVFLHYLLRSMPERLHLVITTRNAFLESSPELRLKKFIDYIRMDDLIFSPEDIADYYGLCGLRLTASEQEQLYACSEGWISALYLIMLDYLKNGVFTPSGDISSLVRHVVYMPLNDELKSLLNHLCVFDAFTADQARYIWQKDNAGFLLDELVRQNAFIRINTLTGEYHLHNIFSACVRDEFSLLPETTRTELWHRAGQWQMQKNEYVAAMDCFYKARYFECLLQAFEKDRSYTTNGQYKEKMVRYLSDCPYEIRQKHHYAFLIYARLLFMVNDQVLFAKTCSEMFREISADATINDETRNTLLGEFQLMISFSKYNSIEGMGNHFLQADRLMKSPSIILDTVSNWTMGAPSILYMFYREPNSLDREIELMKWGLGYYNKLTGGHGLGAAEVFEAECRFMRGEFDESEILLYRAMARASETQQYHPLRGLSAGSSGNFQGRLSGCQRAYVESGRDPEAREQIHTA
jgi:LuxR family maltose regulon positive regulatory protein